ncbi:MAG: glycosyltransferase family 4 protein [Rhodospirillales bacterium]|jgi:UDP-N-acetylmuramyl pentapeptide phosphotransferase/UDP-N-acetylglucosamine-1-phosphate transferase|nr:glycosyltransferase family 4 protein [Rhodospirillales bacterium]MDP6804477.1 glycosyltransferase family 4 protein [Rhodospirillales bacterium]
MSWPSAAAYVIAALVASFAGTRLALWALGRRAILDHPNERSSHVTPKPRGAGLAVIAVVIVAWGALGTGAPSFERTAILTVCAGAFGLAALSFVDDLKGISVGWRLLGQFAAVAAVLAATAERGSYFAGILPPSLDLLAAAVVWVWFINLFNFMDGIDGIAGVETASIGFGVTCAALLAGFGLLPALLGLTVAAAALGFLWWNWEPAKVFLGDVGSVPLGFLLGWLLLDLSARGLWVAAAILPSYYFADATITLGRRALRRAPVWRAHREHFYQRAVRSGRPHAAVAGTILIANVLLIALACLGTVGWTIPALLGAAVVVGALVLHLASDRQPDNDAPAPPAAA